MQDGIIDSFAHMPAMNGRRSARYFCRYSGNIVQRYFLHNKKPFKPAIIFWIIKENEVHVLRVTREAYHWKHFFATHKNYEYRYSALDLENDKRHLDEEHEEHLKREDHTRSRCRRSDRTPTVNAGFAFCADSKQMQK